ncbi:MAG TPA: response regulator [Bacteroidales bacterium]|nr:response regulator [Bacteroidales bacterium]
MAPSTIKRVFILEDNKTEGMLLRLCLGAIPGLSIENFPDGRTLLSRIDDEPEVLITGLNGKSEIEIIKTVKTITPGTEIIVISAQPDIDMIAKAQEAGIYNYVVKGDGCIEYIKAVLEKYFETQD